MRLLATVQPVEGPVDFVDVVSNARDAGDDTMLFERGAAGAVSVAGIGCALDIVATEGGAAAEDPSGRVVDREEGTDRLLAAARLWTRIAGNAQGGPVLAIGGCAFRVDRDPGPPWQGFPAVLLRVPRLALRRQGDTTVAIRAGLDGSSAVDQSALAVPTAGPADGTSSPAVPFRAPAARRLVTEVPRPPHQWLSAVGAVVDELSRGCAVKAVLARELLVHADGPVDARSVLHALRGRHPSCFIYLIPGADGSALVGASPELLIERRGATAISQPMAGSAPRGRNAREDERIAGTLLSSAKERDEHAVVVNQMLERFRRAGARAVHASEVGLARLATIQHLATTIEAEFSPPAPTLLELCASLHPTAAVGGEPWAEAAGLIDEYERMDRGWYAGAVGWTDSAGDGELAVTLRCGLLWEDGVRLYAGGGLMRDSDPARELAETDLKFLALLDALRESPPRRRTTRLDDPPDSPSARSARRRSPSRAR